MGNGVVKENVGRDKVSTSQSADALAGTRSGSGAGGKLPPGLQYDELLYAQRCLVAQPSCKGERLALPEVISSGGVSLAEGGTTARLCNSGVS